MNNQLKPLADRLASRFPDASRRIADDLASYASFSLEPREITLDDEAGHSVVIDAGQSWRLVCRHKDTNQETELPEFANIRERVLGAGTRHFSSNGSLSWHWPPGKNLKYVLEPLSATKGALVLSHARLRGAQQASRAVRYASLSFLDAMTPAAGTQSERNSIEDIERILIVAPGMEADVERHDLVERLAHSVANIRAKSTVFSKRPRVAYLDSGLDAQTVDQLLDLREEDPAQDYDQSTVLIWSRLPNVEATVSLLRQWRGEPVAEGTRHIHRIVHITSTPGARLPVDLLELLDPRLFLTKEDGARDYARDPLFVAVVPTVVVARPDRRVTPTRTLTVTSSDNSDASPGASRGADDFFDRSDYRTMRDTTVLTRQGIENHDVAEFDRWARNLFCCRVGLALSGGGACAFRAVPLIRELQSRIGIDVLSGVSGGALIGAYLVADEHDNLRTVLANGGRFMRALPRAVASTQVVEGLVDEDLGYQRIGETSIRYLPITTELPSDKPPRGVVLVAGTLGQGVRVSGAMPGLFATTIVDRRRYSDGGGASLVPASFLSGFGADLTIACNCIPGPAHGNLLRLGDQGTLQHKIGSALYALLGRGTDAVTWSNYAMQRAAAEFGRHADVFIEFEPSNIALLESGEWSASHAIAAKGEVEMSKIRAAVDRLSNIWRRLL